MGKLAEIFCTFTHPLTFITLFHFFLMHSNLLEPNGECTCEYETPTTIGVFDILWLRLTSPFAARARLKIDKPCCSHRLIHLDLLVVHGTFVANMDPRSFAMPGHYLALPQQDPSPFSMPPLQPRPAAQAAAPALPAS